MAEGDERTQVSGVDTQRPKPKGRVTTTVTTIPADKYDPSIGAIRGTKINERGKTVRTKTTYRTVTTRRPKPMEDNSLQSSSLSETDQALSSSIVSSDRTSAQVEKTANEVSATTLPESKIETIETKAKASLANRPLPNIDFPEAPLSEENTKMVDVLSQIANEKSIFNDLSEDYAKANTSLETLAEAQRNHTEKTQDEKRFERQVSDIESGIKALENSEEYQPIKKAEAELSELSSKLTNLRLAVDGDAIALEGVQKLVDADEASKQSPEKPKVSLLDRVANALKSTGREVESKGRKALLQRAAGELSEVGLSQAEKADEVKLLKNNNKKVVEKLEIEKAVLEAAKNRLENAKVTTHAAKNTLDILTQDSKGQVSSLDLRKDTLVALYKQRENTRQAIFSMEESKDKATKASSQAIQDGNDLEGKESSIQNSMEVVAAAIAKVKELKTGATKGLQDIREIANSITQTLVAAQKEAKTIPPSLLDKTQKRVDEIIARSKKAVDISSTEENVKKINTLAISDMKVGEGVQNLAAKAREQIKKIRKSSEAISDATGYVVNNKDTINSEGLKTQQDIVATANADISTTRTELDSTMGRVNVAAINAKAFKDDSVAKVQEAEKESAEITLKLAEAQKASDEAKSMVSEIQQVKADAIKEAIEENAKITDSQLMYKDVAKSAGKQTKLMTECIESCSSLEDKAAVISTYINTAVEKNRDDKGEISRDKAERIELIIAYSLKVIVPKGAKEEDIKNAATRMFYEAREARGDKLTVGQSVHKWIMDNVGHEESKALADKFRENLSKSTNSSFVSNTSFSKGNLEKRNLKDSVVGK